ncbi:hypothetical protein [Mycolicibacterium sediminis]|uniref:Condensation domain-containing protein n=1 Tax=Mycolicibacterium sediminis TaxID=1286180 RepID=A0A7I7QNY3_9MYCO|nr:hypothetical protein [Mycolicibacterium sediminis]BBY27922.1 hypothetical protein MSEDJ_20180 [Mycolicibacterium sediminis]
MSAVKVSPLDMMWAKNRIISAVGPVDAGRPEQIASVVRKLAARGGPGTRFGLIPSTDTRTWRHAPDDFLGDVTELPACTAGDLPALLTRRARSSTGSSAVNVAIAGDYLIVDMCHGLGDVHLVDMLNSVIGERRSYDSLPDWSLGTPTRHPLGKALAHFYGARPRRMAALLRNRNRAPAVPTAAGASVAWHRAPTMVAAQSTGDVLERVRQARARSASGVSIASIVSAAIVVALRSHGIESNDSVNVVFDCRRYLPGGARIFGNFVSGVDIAVGDPGDPGRLHRGIGDAASSGRPLAALLLNARKFESHYRSGHAFDPATRVASAPVAKLVFSHVGSIFMGTVGDEARRFGNCLNEPMDPEAIVFTISHHGSDFDVSASFHSNVFFPELIQSALNAVAEEPELALTRQIRI